MNSSQDPGILASMLKDAYVKIFYKNWPVWLGGLLIGINSIVTFAWERPLGVVGGLREWIDWLFYSAKIYGIHPHYGLHLSSSSVLTFGLLWGAFASALLSKQFAIKIPPPFELLRGALGGTLMGIGATMAMGCNVGGFFSAVSALSLGGLAMMAGLIVGVFLEIHYFYWEVEWLQPYFGASAVVLAFAAAFIYRSYGVDPASGYSYVKTGGLLISGLAFGIILHRSRFAFLQAFREPFASGNADQARGMAIAVIVSVIGFAALKAGGLRPEWAYINSTFWIGSFIGGIIFGFGMPFAGGCGSGTCWRSAEGGVKQIIAFTVMGITNSLFKSYMDSSETLTLLMGKRVFLPEYISYPWAVILIVAIMMLYYLVASWNEKTRAFI
ncbi:MAG: YeeE/YedE family protein [Nitrospirae bacterium]|nr:YeeE/YedE family protein [Nitrospirota bacterium]